MIDAELAAFIEGPVMIVFATASAAGRPLPGRAAGALCTSGGEIDLFVPGGRWREAADEFRVGAPLAVTFCRPSDYRTFQLKGVLTSVAPAGDAELSAARRYVRAAGDVLLGLGVGQLLIDQWLGCEDLITLRLKPASVFAQTPGPDAGAPLAGMVR